MKVLRDNKVFLQGRKWFFTLALFLLVFAAASIVKVHAVSNITGYLWGGSEDKNIGGNYDVWPPDGNETGVGEIRMSGKTQDGLHEYGVNIPSGDGLITGGNNYAWSENIGWVDFDGVNVATVGNEKRLSGQARIIAIRDAGANAGGWQGWIKLAADGTGAGCAGSSNYSNSDRCNYGVKIDSSGNFSGYGWNGEGPGTGLNMADGLGWINFAKAKYTPSCTPLDGGCGGAQWTTYCSGDPAPTPATPNLCNSDSSLVSESISPTEPWSWKCVNTICPGIPADCPTHVSSSVPGECGSANGSSMCNNSSTPEWCKPGSTVVGGTAPSTDGYDLTWKCAGTCSPVVADCSARGKKTCGWIETTP